MQTVVCSRNSSGDSAKVVPGVCSLLISLIRSPRLAITFTEISYIVQAVMSMECLCYGASGTELKKKNKALRLLG